MDLGTKTANDLLSKDFNVSHCACESLINHKDFESFKKVVDASEFIFPFIKEKINNNLLKCVNSSNYKNLFSFMKLYSYDFDDFIVRGLVKFASQDLTDEIYDIFENGSDDEKMYCALYFSYINDEIAIDLLNKYAMSDNEELAEVCVKTLSVFDNRELFNNALDIISTSSPDDFIENIKYFNFLINYGDQDVLPVLFKYVKDSPVSYCALPDLLNLVSYSDLIDNNDIDVAVKIYIEHLGAYPEFISLATLSDFELLDFIKFLYSVKENNPLLSLAILKTKVKFDLFKDESAYQIELNKAQKEYLNKIFEYLKTIDNNFYSYNIDNLKYIFDSQDNEQIIDAFEIILELKLEQYSDNIINLVLNSKNETIVCEGIKLLKTFNKIHLLNKDEIVSRIGNENIKAIILSYFD